MNHKTQEVIQEAIPVEETGYIVNNLDAIKNDKLRQILYKFDIQDDIVNRVKHLLCGTKKVLLLDNSGSMSLALQKTSFKSDSGKPIRRYDELLHFIEVALPFLVLEEPNGIDIWLLNNVGGHLHGTPGPVLIENVQTVEQVRDYLMNPCGRTPLVQCMSSIFRQYAVNMEEEGLHLIVATDGAPNSVVDKHKMVNGQVALYNLLSNNSILRKNPSKCIVNFIVCSDNETDVEYLDKIDNECPYVDVTDDYNSEAEQVSSKKTFPYPLSTGDWVLKALIGAADPSLDKLDEINNNKECCIIV